MQQPSHIESGHSHRQRFFLRAATALAAATLASRIVGFAREVVLARFFGTGMAADALRGAGQIPNLLRVLLGEGAISAALVPVLAGHLVSGQPDEANRVASGVLNLILLGLGAVCAVGMLFTPFFTRLIVPGFVAEPAKFELVVQLARIMFPSVLFMALAGLAMGVLNSHDRFAMPAIAPAAISLTMIVAMLAFASSWGALAAAWGFLLGSVVMLVIQIPSLRAVGYRHDLGLHVDSESVRAVFLGMLPVVLAAASYSINGVVDSRFASTLGEGPLAAVGYSLRLWGLPVSLFAVSVATVVFPSMSRHASVADSAALGHEMALSMRLITILMAPAMTTFLVLAIPLVGLVYERGAFTHVSTLLTASATFYYAPGLIAAGLLHVVNRGYFALKDARAPMYVAAGSIAANYVLDWALMRGLPWFATQVLGLPATHHLSQPVGGLALATSVVSTGSVLVLLMLFRRRVGGLEGRRLLQTCIRVGMACLALGTAALITFGLLDAALAGAALPPTVGRLLSVGGGVTIGLAAYAGALSLLRVPEARTAWRTVTRRSAPEGE